MVWMKGLVVVWMKGLADEGPSDGPSDGEEKILLYLYLSGSTKILKYI